MNRKPTRYFGRFRKYIIWNFIFKNLKQTEINGMYIIRHIEHEILGGFLKI